MSDFHRPNSWRLLLLMVLTVVTMGGISILWEFQLEELTMHLFGLPYDADFENFERWNFVLTSTGFSVLSIILPTALLKRLVKNTHTSYRRMQSEHSMVETFAKYDSLSGLINRRVFMDLLEERLREAQPTVVFLVDLDHFKSINDNHGHGVGDSVICETASRLEDIAQAHNAIAARLGGDEFCLLLLGDPGIAMLEKLADLVITGLSAPMPFIPESSGLGATVGIARSLSDSQDTSTLLHFADTAMYRGKQSGRSTYSFYDPAYERQMRADRDLDFALRQAVDRQEIIPYFQPIVALPSQEVVGFEILARWLKPDGTTGMPTDFIPVLDRLGLIPDMTRSLVRQACAATRHWDNELTLSLNVSAAMIIDEEFPDRLLSQLREEGFPYKRFEVEITEEALVGNLAAASRSLSRLHAHGIVVALDDFGTGYSGLYHLTRLAIDKIKIDRSFFEPGADDHLPMVQAILGMARSLNMKVTAEGIEEFHLPNLPTWLAVNGCHFAQGYLFGRPHPIV
ncbi:putative bifunctional diguanylate cyclase/phosphodiesterase [Pseudomonas syringae group genomosp. 3]|uniref:putative bifunctional diguanylate cyclase/phosphodiesterase n=1 Tax=Pseudomonas syringae group genomosp. 3 TaxID=251701 RepID=UPI00217F649D|nr:EAL domain-containing protein [Pseudomonas syringae group genomosp. 3]